MMTNRSERFLEAALLFALVIHFVATVAMGTLLLPAMPGAINTDAARVAYIADYRLLWHLGWLPWHLCALSDLILVVAMLRTKWIPKAPAVVTLILTIVAVLLEQPAEFLWNFEGARLARLCAGASDLAPYLDFEKSVFLYVGSLAAIVYALMAYGWSWCFAKAGTWSKTLTYLSAVTWTLLLCTAAAPLLPDSVRPPLLVIGVGNAIGFNLMAVWFVLVLEQVLRRSRHEEKFGRMALWSHPQQDVWGRVLSTAANSRFLRYIGELAPSVELVSDIEDVIYINYLVDAEKLQLLVPLGLSLQRLGPEKNYALFSVLTYRHGNFGPSLCGASRGLMPSPVQSNWRIHVRDADGTEGIYFVATVVTHPAVAFGGRILSDGVPMHLAQHGTVTRDGAGNVSVLLEPGAGSAPDMMASLSPCEKPELVGAWKECFGTFDQFLAYCVPQDRAMSVQPWYAQVTKQEINLGIPLTICEPLQGEVHSKTVENLIGTETPICFRVPQVNFSFYKIERNSAFSD